MQQVECKSSRSIPIKIRDQNKTNIKPTYSLSEKLFDPTSSSPPASDFMKRLYERHVYYNMSENSSNPPNT